MSGQKIIISPKTKVGDLLDNFPHLEPVLIAMSPAFEKLKNPVLRKTIARVATLQQVAVVGGLKVDDIVNRMRKEAGQSNESDDKAETSYLSTAVPSWFEKAKIINIMDASPIINSGASPMSEILRRTTLLNPDEIFELRTPFIPAPIIDMLRAKGFSIYIVQSDSNVLSYISRQ